MTFIRNTWYPAIWASELTPQGPMPVKPVARKICGEDVVFYRSQTSGKIVALHDMCPHRFAPLSYGDVVGDNIKCRYHGLEFGSNGNCMKNPSGGEPPSGVCVKAYHIEQNEELVYLWIGDGEPDKPAPDYIDGTIRQGYGGTLRGVLEAPVNWQILMDNLNDDAHATHLHTLLNSDGHSERNQEYRVEKDVVAPNTVTQTIEMKNTSCIPLLQRMVKDPKARVNHLLRLNWMAPSSVHVTTGVYEPGGDPESQVGVDSMHMVTPSDENSCYYFWCFKRNGDLENHAFTQKMSDALAHIFKTEDIWIAKGQAERMKGREFWSLKPALLPQDKAAVWVRRRIEKLIEESNPS